MSTTSTDLMAAQERALIRRCTDTITKWFPGRRPADLAVLRSVIARRTGRPIRREVADLGLAGHPTALWLKLIREDVIVLHPYMSTLGRYLGEAHELAHIICGHSPEPFSPDACRRHAIDEAIARHVNIHPGLIMGTMSRCALDTPGTLNPIEREAELTGRLLIAPLLHGDPDINLRHYTAA